MSSTPRRLIVIALVGIVAIFALVFTLFQFATVVPQPADVVLQVLGGEVVSVALRNPDRCQAWLLGPLPDTTDWQRATLADYPLRSPPTIVGVSDAKRIGKLLSSKETYNLESAKGCEPTYGVRLEFRNGTDALDVLLCFECSIFTVFRNSENVGGEDFDAAASELVAIIKRSFPDDAKIQALK